MANFRKCFKHLLSAEYSFNGKKGKRVQNYPNPQNSLGFHCRISQSIDALKEHNNILHLFLSGGSRSDASLPRRRSEQHILVLDLTLKTIEPAFTVIIQPESESLQSVLEEHVQFFVHLPMFLLPRDVDEGSDVVGDGTQLLLAVVPSQLREVARRLVDQTNERLQMFSQVRALTAVVVIQEESTVHRNNLDQMGMPGLIHYVRVIRLRYELTHAQYVAHGVAIADFRADAPDVVYSS